MTTLFGFDVGTKLIGVAIGNTFTSSARGLTSITVRDGSPDWNKLDALRREWMPEQVVVGLPLDAEGAEQPMTKTARRFARQLGERWQLPIQFADERNTSQEAARRFASARKAGLKKRSDVATIDAEAAAVILESWLAQTI
jgi:putative Holliday junction resolvase